jgi:type III secretory pathway component EscT
MSPDTMAQLRFLLTDLVQILKLIIAVSVPVAVVAAIGIWIFAKHARQR